MKVIYREIKKADYAAIKNIINESFGLYRYVNDKNVLKSGLDIYLQSCLAEQTFTCVAEADGKVVGVIMGQSKCDYRKLPHLKYIISLVYHNILFNVKAFFAKTDVSDLNLMHQIYDDQLKKSEQTFDGVLTLFAVSAECRGLGVGRTLLHMLLDYQRTHHVKNVYLHTDSSCNYGFYDVHGFTRLSTARAQLTRSGKNTIMEVYLYGYKM